ncbi:hypothetical protein [Plantibacter sp. CFBP 8804]|uniref:hypothetical protein n=1 Tax=Plantibacter sp. CFBP 8804 TaxID=2775270 RepID=UPI001781DBE1|nr:hypothetical protein [Plantibacter sp. CFBP 8804]MBD8517078.1 hypothetical protein [Plantibacter sp. CFBP 8804]
MTVTPRTVDARFAGGYLVVEAAPLPQDAAAATVQLSFPGGELILFPHEALELAAALRAIATGASSDNPDTTARVDGARRIPTFAEARRFVREAGRPE